MRSFIIFVIFALSLTSACADPTIDPPDAGVDADVDAAGPDGPWGDFGSDFSLPDGFELGKAKVFAHTESTLFAVDPDTFAISEIAAFGWPANTDITKMTDIALDKHGRMIGVSKTTVYSVNPETAECTRMASFPVTDYHFVGLSYVVDTTAIDKAEYLMGLDKEGAVYEIDPATGAVTQRGSLGGGLQASGDVVSVKGFGTVATVLPTGSDTDWLAQIDPGSGKATLVGDTGYAKIWGLGFWKGKVFGFSEGGEFVLIDVNTGAATLEQTSEQAWWGAGVTTEAPVIN